MMDQSIHAQLQHPLPQQYLLLQLHAQLTISRIHHSTITPLLISPLSEPLIFSIVKQVISRESPELRNQPIQDIINTIFQKGDSQKADLLVEDIFGADNCAIIGLPAKLIAASLGKFAKQEQVSSSFWDQLSGLLNALAINTGLLAREWMILTNLDRLVFKTSVQWPNRMLYTLRTLLGPETQVFIAAANKLSFQVLPKQLQF